MPYQFIRVIQLFVDRMFDTGTGDRLIRVFVPVLISNEFVMRDAAKISIGHSELGIVLRLFPCEVLFIDIRGNVLRSIVK